MKWQRTCISSGKPTTNIVEISSPFIVALDPLAIFEETKPGGAPEFEDVLPATPVGTCGP
jgi:hypothetical protein